MNVATRRTVRGTYGLGAVSQTMQATGGVLMSLAPVPVAGPFIAMAGAVTELLASIGIGAGCGNTCIQATDYANQAEVLLKQNLNTYLALPTPRAQSAQQAALANFNNIWNGLLYSCAGVPGAAGQNCIGDRQQGACHFKDSNGNCWNWFIGYHDPIANDTQTYNDTLTSGPTQITAATSTGTTVGSTSTGPNVLLIAGGALALILVVSLL